MGGTISLVGLAAATSWLLTIMSTNIVLETCNEKAKHTLLASNLPAYFCAEERIIWKTMHALKEYYSSVKLS